MLDNSKSVVNHIVFLFSNLFRVMEIHEYVCYRFYLRASLLRSVKAVSHDVLEHTAQTVPSAPFLSNKKLKRTSARQEQEEMQSTTTNKTNKTNTH